MAAQPPTLARCDTLARVSHRGGGAGQAGRSDFFTEVGEAADVGLKKSAVPGSYQGLLSEKPLVLPTLPAAGLHM